MESTLRAIQKHPKLTLQIIATGMHLDPAHGKPLSAIRDAGFKVNETVPWGHGAQAPFLASWRTGVATASFSLFFKILKTHIIIIVGDRVEVFAAAAAAHISGIPVAHIHGGDRALGQIDDSLRHAITKLSHIHFPATKQSAQRIRRLGEDLWRIKLVGSPGIDGITMDAWSFDQSRDYLRRENDRELLSTGGCFDPASLRQDRYALLLLHPSEAEDAVEARQAEKVLFAVLAVPFENVLILYPNNDPGSAGIVKFWDRVHHAVYRATPQKLARRVFIRNLPRPAFLSLLKNAAVLIGNSSSGIIEAASFGTPVINIGDRQKGRERNKNVIDVPANAAAIRRALKKVWNNGHPIRFPRHNIYGSGRTSEKIARILATIPLDDRLRRKLISY
jgi:UDP-hydrolysing UDP-N-acetyl-D-glucosamine 2-epimerase